MIVNKTAAVKNEYAKQRIITCVYSEFSLNEKRLNLRNLRPNDVQ